jgi:hypothetical protein
MARKHRSAKSGSETRHPSWWERRTALQKWVLGIFVTALASTVTATVAGLYNAAGHAVVNKVAPPTPVPDPLTVAVSLHPPQAACSEGVGWVRPTSVAALRPPAASDTATTAWYVQHGMVPASGNYVEVTVQNRPGQSIVLNGLDVQVLRRRSPPAGYAGIVSGGCGAFPARFFVADLDRMPPIVVATPGSDLQTNQPVPAINFPYQVADTTTPEVFHVKAYTGACDCDWRMELSWVAAGRTGTTRITDHGQPFRTSATSAARTVAQGYCYGCVDGKPYRGPLEFLPKPG